MDKNDCIAKLLLNMLERVAKEHFHLRGIAIRDHAHSTKNVSNPTIVKSSQTPSPPSSPSPKFPPSSSPPLSLTLPHPPSPNNPPPIPHLPLPQLHSLHQIPHTCFSSSFFFSPTHFPALIPLTVIIRPVAVNPTVIFSQAD